MKPPPNDYLTVVTTRRGQNLQMADMYRLGRLLQSGCTLVLDMVGAFEPSMEVTCRALQWWSRELVQVNAYLTTQDASGFTLHWDDHDILVVQLAGDKYWEFRSCSRSVPMYRDTAQNRTPGDDVIWTGNLSAGDVMHIPRGYWHQATRADQGEGFSLHVTFGFVKRTGVDWLTWLADRSRENELFRHDLNRWGSSPERAAQGAELLEAASRLLTSLSPSDFLIERQDSRPPHRHVTTFGIFGAPTAVVCVTEFPPRLEQCGDAIEVFAAGKKITLAARAAPALRMLLSGHPVNLSEATMATGIDAGIIADVLVAEGICAELTPRWGMSPFAGRPRDPVWSAVNVRTFLEPGQECSIPQAAFRVSYELPAVGRMVVGATSVEHLRELVAARRLRVDKIRIARYRELLRVKAATVRK